MSSSSTLRPCASTARRVSRDDCDSAPFHFFSLSSFTSFSVITSLSTGHHTTPPHSTREDKTQTRRHEAACKKKNSKKRAALVAAACRSLSLPRKHTTNARPLPPNAPLTPPASSLPSKERVQARRGSNPQSLVCHPSYRSLAVAAPSNAARLGSRGQNSSRGAGTGFFF